VCYGNKLLAQRASIKSGVDSSRSSQYRIEEEISKRFRHAAPRPVLHFATIRLDVVGVAVSVGGGCGRDQPRTRPRRPATTRRTATVATRRPDLRRDCRRRQPEGIRPPPAPPRTAGGAQPRDRLAHQVQRLRTTPNTMPGGRRYAIPSISSATANRPAATTSQRRTIDIRSPSDWVSQEYWPGGTIPRLARSPERLERLIP
jgi:hypothetical protein